MVAGGRRQTLSANGPGFRASAMHCRIISRVRVFIRRVAFPNRSMKLQSISSSSYRTLRMDNKVV